MKRPRPPVTLIQAQRRIPTLARQFIPPFSEPENLDLPLDPDIALQATPPSTKIVLRVNNEDASWCGVVDFAQQFGPVHLRMGGIADVRTHDHHRFQGYGRRVLVNALRFMRRERFDVSQLYGISGFYPKFGYAPAFPAVTHTVAVRDAELATGPALRFVDYTPAHLSGVLQLYHQYNAGRIGPTRRDEKTWTAWHIGLYWHTAANAQVALDSRRRVVAYFVHDLTHTNTILELAAAAPAFFPALLRACAAHAWNHRNENLVFRIAQDDPFIQFCQPFGLHTHLEYRRDGGAMVRLIHVPAALQKLAPVLAPRLPGRGRLTLRTNLDSATLAWSHGRLQILPAAAPQAEAASGPTLRLPQWTLAQLLYGYADVPTLARAGHIRGPEESLATLAALFPPTPHYHYHVDNF